MCPCHAQTPALFTPKHLLLAHIDTYFRHTCFPTIAHKLGTHRDQTSWTATQIFQIQHKVCGYPRSPQTIHQNAKTKKCNTKSELGFAMLHHMVEMMLRCCSKRQNVMYCKCGSKERKNLTHSVAHKWKQKQNNTTYYKVTALPILLLVCACGYPLDVATWPLQIQWFMPRFQHTKVQQTGYNKN